jgi:hypothetical protein
LQLEGPLPLLGWYCHDPMTRQSVGQLAIGRILVYSRLGSAEAAARCPPRDRTNCADTYGFNFEL